MREKLFIKKAFDISLQNFQAAYQRLTEVVELRPLTDILRDSTLQRFEFTFELCWKTLRLYYKDKGKDLRYPKDVIKESFNDGFIENEQVFLEILEDRNRTVHVYDQEHINRIYSHIVKHYVAAFGKVLQTLAAKQQ